MAESDAETLRRAAALMRERAVAVDDWYSAQAWATASPMSLPIDPADAAHIVSWHPAVALAVADWLNKEADLNVTMNELVVKSNAAGISASVACSSMPEALAVARAYMEPTP